MALLFSIQIKMGFTLLSLSETYSHVDKLQSSLKQLDMAVRTGGEFTHLPYINNYK